MARQTVDATASKLRKFSDWVRGELRRQKKNQAQLASYIGTDQPGLSLRLNGKRTWTLKEYFDTLEFFEAEEKESW